MVRFKTFFDDKMAVFSATDGTYSLECCFVDEVGVADPPYFKIIERGKELNVPTGLKLSSEGVDAFVDALGKIGIKSAEALRVYKIAHKEFIQFKKHEEKAEKKEVPPQKKQVFAVFFEDVKNNRIAMRFFDELTGQPFFYVRDLNTPFNIDEIERLDTLEFDTFIVKPVSAIPTEGNSTRIDVLLNPPTQLEPFESFDALLAEMRQLISSRLILSPDCLDALCLYMAWAPFFRKANFFPLGRLIATLGRAKSRFAVVVFYLFPNAVLIADPTAAGLKRIARKYKTLQIVDEGDEINSDEAATITKIYNCGTSPDNPLIEASQETQEGEGDLVVSGVSSPKLVCTRRSFKDEALESKAIHFKLPAVKIKDLRDAEIPIVMQRNDPFYAPARHFTNKFATAILALYPEVEENNFDWIAELGTSDKELAEFIEDNIEPRLLQTFTPLLMMGKHLKDAKKMMLGIFLRNVILSLERLSNSHDGQVAKALLFLLGGDANPTFQADKDIAPLNIMFEEDDVQFIYASALYAELEKNLDTKDIIACFERLGLQKERKRIELVWNDNGDIKTKKVQRTFVRVPDEDALMEIRRKYDFEPQKKKLEDWLERINTPPVQAVQGVQGKRDGVVDNFSFFEGDNTKNDEKLDGGRPLLLTHLTQAAQNSENKENCEGGTPILTAQPAQAAQNPQVNTETKSPPPQMGTASSPENGAAAPKDKKEGTVEDGVD